MNYHLGTSGWSYPHWRGLFYPVGVTARDWLSFYAGNFGTVEINMTFYRYPKPEMLRGWLIKTPADFTFTLKANRQITHIKKLRDVHHELRYFEILAHSLGPKLGCVLYQLPPSLIRDEAVLKDFLADLPPDCQHVIEFRHESWYTDSVYEMLRERCATFCTVSSAKVPKTYVQTSETAYFRFHGLTGEHRYDYSDQELEEWAGMIRECGAQEAYIYFNNDYRAQAVRNALKLRELLEGPSQDSR